MQVWGYILAAFVSLALFAGCDGDAAVEGLCGQLEEYSSVEDCLNGCSVVGDGRRFGVVDDGGRVVVPVQYDRLFFLEDDVIAGFSGEAGHFAGTDSGVIRGGQWRFIDTVGNVLGEVCGEAEDEPETLLAEVRRILLERERVWEGIVSGYECFCERCAVDGVAFWDMKTVADSLREEMRFADGWLSEGQRRRIEQAYRRYREGRVL